jgi:FSR family fosmidomycin resistance protein-like MFS transporter
MPARRCRARVIQALAVLAMLVFSKYIYMASLSSYYTFFLIEKFHVPVGTAQMYLFLFLASVAVGTFAGGPIGDRIGRKRVIWVSILGAAPFTLALPYADLFWTGVLSVVIGLVMSSAFSAIVVFAQELVPGKVGMIAGIFFGLMFGISGIGAAAMGHIADVLRHRAGVPDRVLPAAAGHPGGAAAEDGKGKRLSWFGFSLHVLRNCV